MSSDTREERERDGSMRGGTRGEPRLGNGARQGEGSIWGSEGGVWWTVTMAKAVTAWWGGGGGCYVGRHSDMG